MDNMFMKPTEMYAPTRIFPTDLSDDKIEAVEPLAAPYDGHIDIFDEFLKYDQSIPTIKVKNPILSRMHGVSSSEAKALMIRGLTEKHLDKQSKVAEYFLKGEKVRLKNALIGTSPNRKRSDHALITVKKVERVSFEESGSRDNPLFKIRYGDEYHQVFIVTTESTIEIC